jgi:hypothetical protein
VTQDVVAHGQRLKLATNELLVVATVARGSEVASRILEIVVNDIRC